MDDRDVVGPPKRRKGMAGWLLAACIVCPAGPASAQWAVVDLPHTVKTALGWVAQYQQMIEDYKGQIEQLQTLNKQYEQALVTGQGYSGSAGLRESFGERALDEGLVERCGTAPARHPKGTEQHAYCSAIVRTENRRFNAVVAMLEDVEARDAELREAYEERAGIQAEEEGKLASNTNRILSIQGQLQNDMQNAESLMNAYDTSLRALRENHVRVANEALTGSAGSQVAQGVALKAALQAARGRER